MDTKIYHVQDIDIRTGEDQKDKQAGNAKRPQPVPERVVVLHMAADLTSGDRAATYGHPNVQLAVAQRLYDTLENAGGASFGPGHRNALSLICTKLARIVCAPGQKIHRDNYVDLAAYAAIAYECEVMYRGPNNTEQAAGNSK